MAICQFCSQLVEEGKCYLGLRLPKSMRCHEFAPGLDKFCSNPGDFVNTGQIVQMATFFGMKGPELKKVMAMARGEEARLKESK
jgi:hypothetical protein